MHPQRLYRNSKMDSIDPASKELLRPIYKRNEAEESQISKSIIDALSMQVHVEGGYYVETDRDSRRVHNPFAAPGVFDSTRSASTTIFYLLTPSNPQGGFHRNKGRTVHTLHRGRGRYVIIHADEVNEPGEKARLETFIVGQDVQKGERLQWIVDGGKFKASFLLSNDEDKDDYAGLLISETVVPGFEFEDHDFMTPETLRELVTSEQEAELKWLLRPDQ